MRYKMKKKLYYIIPFIIIPTLMLLCELLDNLELLRMSPYILCTLLLLASAVFGFFSSTDRTFDYLMTAIMPLSLFCLMFIAGFLDKDDMGTRFHLDEAIETAFQPIAFILYFLMAFVTLWASFKHFRSIKNRISNSG